VNRRVFIGLATLALMAGAIPGGALAVDPPEEEFRAYWVDAFGEGIYNEAEVDELVAAAKAANMNAIVAQIGRRADCFCNNAIMPRTQAPIAALPYDPLQTLIDKAHAEGIEVHAWIIATAIGSSSAPPSTNPDHVYNAHGRSAVGYDNWVMRRWTNTTPPGDMPAGETYLDPGHPDAADYIVSMYTSLAQNYDIDGLNFDRIRYPDGQLGTWPDDNAWGYNPVALQRFHAATGRSDTPLPNDAEWSQWRREQVTNIVRRVYLEVYAIDPSIQISADTITYGDGPQQLGGWEASRPYRETLQDWRGWMEEGILDLNIPMNYKREWCTGGPIPGCFGGFSQQAWYEHWNEFIKDNQYGRQTVVGAALYLNGLVDSVVQVRKALAPSSAGNSGWGWVGYSYRNPDDLALAGTRTGAESRAELVRALTEESEYDAETPPVFADAAVVPEMSWKTQPTTGHALGTVRTADGAAFDQVTVELRNASSDALVATHLTDGTGNFGFVDLAPGRYKVLLDPAVAHGGRVAAFTVRAGQVTEVALTAKPR
jgi:uncharacterized lipoprotein YddW (UPF0748 family)